MRVTRLVVLRIKKWTCRLKRGVTILSIKKVLSLFDEPITDDANGVKRSIYIYVDGSE